MNKELFRFDKQNKILLYGAATTGTLMMKTLEDNGLCVEGFIDQRANEIDCLLGKKVYPLDELNGLYDSIIVVAVKNVFEHSNIAAKLIKKGCHNIIYRDRSVLEGNGDRNLERINALYSAIENNNLKQYVGNDYPCTYAAGLNVLKCNIIDNAKDSIVVNVPITMLFTDKKGEEDRSDIPVLALVSHIQFVDFVLGKKGGDYRKYLDFCISAAKRINSFEITEAWKENVIRNRAEVVLRMNHSFEFDTDFFKRAAVKVKWNPDRKAFNLCSGKHRATFLVEKDMNYIPVNMSVQDFASWKNCLGGTETQEGLAIEDSKIIAPTENPWTYHILGENDQFFFLLIRQIIRDLCTTNHNPFVDNNWDNTVIICDLDDGGFIGRFFGRCHIKTIYGNGKKRILKEKNGHGYLIYIGEKKEGLDESVDVSYFYEKHTYNTMANTLFSAVYNGEPIIVGKT